MWLSHWWERSVDDRTNTADTKNLMQVPAETTTEAVERHPRVCRDDSTCLTCFKYETVYKMQTGWAIFG